MDKVELILYTLNCPLSHAVTVEANTMQPLNTTSVFDFSNLITMHCRNFTGRKWVFAEIDRWLAQPTAPQFFIITGEPGIGKTAIAAQVAQRRALAAMHFCIARQADTIDPLNFARSLAHQCLRIDGFAAGILHDTDTHIQSIVNVSENRDREKPRGSPLPHHQAYGSVPWRFDMVTCGEVYTIG